MAWTTRAIDAVTQDQHLRALHDGELDLVGGGDVYMQGPRGSEQRLDSTPVLPPVLRAVLSLIGL